MKIFNQEINIDDLISEKYMHKEVKEGIFLTDYQVDVLLRNGIKETDYNSLNELIFLLNEILEEDDNEELELVERQISEFQYYNCDPHLLLE